MKLTDSLRFSVKLRRLNFLGRVMRRAVDADHARHQSSAHRVTGTTPPAAAPGASSPEKGTGQIKSHYQIKSVRAHCVPVVMAELISEIRDAKPGFRSAN